MHLRPQLRFWVAQHRGPSTPGFWRDGVERFTAAIQAVNFDGFSHWGTVSFKRTHYLVVLSCHPEVSCRIP